MRANSKSYPRAKVRKIVKAHSRKHVGKTVDALVFLNFILFVEELLSNASHKARLNGERVTAAKDIRKVTMDDLELKNAWTEVQNEHIRKGKRRGIFSYERPEQSSWDESHPENATVDHT
ncbi:hypothetical protein A1O7_05227 [Cladophialophora yegresii CBS 114405]|uniref:Transcription factor CBF/NF-Y/archaeal histone domain-containing protein n=1 Tax=Cladophialophora yegresii CBS 114405 TaxID=1182544 RepID=W9WRU2_9EURO|nr:uncharacterized protein A1O7_05227 [Cladophialophora yegresii CBS 114405]EXJ61074.1 hypothetical protein A1O7_05227 [Cladophialophora yegresii CBS 114405]